MSLRRALSTACGSAALVLGVVGGAAAAFPGSNGALTFFYSNEIFVMPANGAVARSLGEGLSPAWSPNGRLIAFDAIVNRNDDIWVMRPDGRARRRVTTSPAPDYFAAWSPDGRSIVFTSDRGNGEDLYVIGADGRNERSLTNDDLREFGGAWSPDGSLIAFAGNSRGNLEVEVANADGTNRRALTDHPARDEEPAWSPDGTRIAFTSERDGNANVYVMNADGSGLQPLTDDPSNDRRPSWSPDGTSIAFESDRDPVVFDRDVYVMNADGSNQHRLRTGDLNARDVDWQPTIDLTLTARRSGRSVVAQVANRSSASALRVRVTFTSGKRRRARDVGALDPGATRSVAVVMPRRTEVLASGWQIDPNPADNRRVVRGR
jgi:Tol biopolymer transport system component